MITTSQSLLERIRTGSETRSWNRFVRLYTPVIYRWVRGKGVPSHDASDMVQEVFRALIRGLPAFQWRESGSFGRWLRTITTNKCRDYFRSVSANRQTTAEQLTVPDVDNVEEFAEREYRQILAHEALQLMQTEFEPNTWKAAWEHIVSGRSAADIAHELGISINSVYVSKSRVLRKLRQELDGLWE